MGDPALKVLLVEDVATDAELLKLYLRRSTFSQFSVTHVSTWQEAALHLKDGSYDVILLDLFLPDSSGNQTFLRALEAAHGIPIIVLTGNEDDALTAEAARHGVQDFILKGTDGRQIARSVRYAMERARIDRELGNYRELLRTVVEGISDAVFAKDLDGRYLLVNQGVVRATGKSKDELLGHSDATVFSPEQARFFVEHDLRVSTEGKSSTQEEPVAIPGREPRTYLTTKSPLKDASGKIIGVLGISRDITESIRSRKHSEGMAALLSLFAVGTSHRKYLPAIVRLLRDWCGCEAVGVRLLDESSRLPYVAQTGFVRGFLRLENEFCLNTGDCICARILTGQPRPYDASCTTPGGSIHCNDLPNCQDHLGGPSTAGPDLPCVKAGYRSLAHIPLRYQRKLIGSLFLADRHPDRFTRDAMVFYEDAALVIAEAIHRLNVEKSLVESELRFRSMFERHASVMLLVNPKTGAIVDANLAAAAFYGYPQRQLRTLKFDDLSAFAAATASHHGDESPRTGSAPILRQKLASGEIRVVEVHSSSIQVEHELLHFVIIHDISERMQLQQQVLEIGEKERQRLGQDLHDSLGGKLAGAALMGKAMAQRLAAKAMPEADLAQELVEYINESIRQTRSIARGLWPSELSASDLAEALSEFAAETQRRTGVSCHFHSDAMLPIHQPFVALNVYRLTLEAVTNAVRHGEPKSIFISLTNASSHLCLEVRDDGKGLKSASHSGTGMGLRTMRYRAETLGGRLSIESARSGGTVIRCVVPVAQPLDAEWHL